MRYYATPSTPRVRDAMCRGLLGAITTPRQGNRLPGGDWIADNGRFGQGWPGYQRWGTWLRSLPVAGCAFAVAPDVPFDAAATLRIFGPAGRFIRRVGYPVALAAQNGLEHLSVPWGAFDVLFLGGDTAWKLGPYARQLTGEARDRGLPVHMGRVNSLRRLRYAQAIGCTSADGTYLAFSPDRNLANVLGWIEDTRDQGWLFDV